jgi:hypothetical protein
VPNVLCTSCGLTSYAVTPHSGVSPCPYCDAELFPALRPATAAAASDEEAGGGEIEAEAA